MGFEADEEILQDFLVESGEILELLSEQLVDLENNPDDNDLLNAIFRGFHTVKGGAGFLQLEALVDCCHVAENVFDILRNGKRSVDSELMDVVLRALDAVNEMFDDVRNRRELTKADPQLLKDLEKFARPQSEGDSAPPAETATPVETAADDSGDITDDEFEQLLDALDEPEGGKQEVASEGSSARAAADDEITDDEFDKLLDELHGEGKPISAPADAPAVSGSDDISDDEFEQLLDDLHGKGSFDTTRLPAGETEAGASDTVSPDTSTGDNKAGDGDADLISDDEFENLLDELHGAGGSPTAGHAPKADAPATSSPSPAPKPEAKTQPKPSPAPAAKPAASTKPAAAAAKPKTASGKSESIATETTVRVDTKRLDDIMNMVGELVLVRNRLKRLGDESSDEPLQKAVSNLDVVTGDLQSAVM